EVVAVGGRLVGESAADVVGDDAAEVVAQREDEVAVVERPRRVAVQHHDRLAPGPLGGGDAEGGRPRVALPLGREELLVYHRSPSIRQLSPLPMPKKPTRSPGQRKSRSSARAAVRGSDTVPMLPRYSKVEKSFSAGMPKAFKMASRWLAPT